MNRRVLRNTLGGGFAAVALLGTLGLTAPVLAQGPTATPTQTQTETQAPAKQPEWSFTGTIKVPDDLLAKLPKFGGHGPGGVGRHARGSDCKQGAWPKDGQQAPAPKDGTPAPAPKDGTPAPAPKDGQKPAPRGWKQGPAPKDGTQAPAASAIDTQLKALAKVTADEAKAAAQAKFAGATVDRVDLRPINGYVVYSVHLTDQQGQHQMVIVDAGNAQVLADRVAGPRGK